VIEIEGMDAIMTSEAGDPASSPPDTLKIARLSDKP
jgi:hypothetical protein